ncbi:substrate-binding and VWA domain-containing protein [Thermoactinospora rubra]|uniref:substrate-binding and VWA domain-containing protein n=1 Tax=Thermoactinospora rubra TaxID=1088767 RepID=UPI001F0A35A9|nr:substrate-binding and VWA domain-containing protein [Thermoactinospora rubra]
MSVAAAVDVAPAVMEAARQYNEINRCALVQVTEQPPATVLRTLLGERAGVLPVRPDAWIADSSAWLRRAAVQRRTVVATSPLVFATRSSLADKFAVGRTEMNWRMVFPATVRGRVQPNENEPDVVRVPDPSLAGAGIATVAAARDVVGTGPDADKSLTAFVRWAQAGAAPDYRSMLAAVDDRTFWRRPVVIVPEQSVWEHNRRPSPDPVVALHPREGTINLDYSYAVTATDRAVAEAAGAFGDWLRGPVAQGVFRRAGFRSADGSQGPISPATGVPTQAPKIRQEISPEDIDEGLRAWSRLAPPTNMLVLAETSRHMAERLKDGTRLSVALAAARLGLQLFPDSTHMGMWEFAERTRPRVTVGPITEPETGQVIRRSTLAQLATDLRAREGEDSHLYRAVLDGFREMTERYAEDMNNALLVVTSGRDDGGGIGLRELTDRLREEWDPDRPVQIIVVAFGDGVDRDALGQITAATNGSLHVAQRPEEIIDVFLSALARRLCHPTCGST